MLKYEFSFLDEREFITFSSDEELLIALRSSRSEVLHIYIKGKLRL